MNEGNFVVAFNKVNDRVLTYLAIRGMTRAGFNLLRDAAFVSPTVPKLTGALRGSGSVFVQNVHQGNSQAEGGEANPNTTHSETIPLNTIVAVIGYNQPQAARLHENPQFKFSLKGSGGKFLTTKLARFSKAYFNEVARTLRDG